MTLDRVGRFLSFRVKTVLGIALIEVALLAILVWSSLQYLGNSSARAANNVDNLLQGRPLHRHPDMTWFQL